MHPQWEFFTVLRHRIFLTEYARSVVVDFSALKLLFGQRLDLTFGRFFRNGFKELILHGWQCICLGFLRVFGANICLGFVGAHYKAVLEVKFGRASVE
jgi:hypothetical protein